MSPLLCLFVLPRYDELIVVPFEILKTDIAVRAKIGGVERRTLITTSTYNSCRVGGTGETVVVEIGGQSIGRVRFLSDSDGGKINGEEARIGMDALKDMAVGIDEARRTLTIWPKGSLSREAAEAWVVAGAPSRVPIKARRLATRRLPIGAPAFDAVVDKKPVSLLLRMAYGGSMFESSVVRESLQIGPTLAYLPSATVDGMPLGPSVYYANNPDPLNKASYGVPGMLSLDVFCSRRVLIDFAADAVFVRESPWQAKLSDFLARLSRCDLAVRDGGIYVEFAEPEDAARRPEAVPYVGSQVVRIADEPTEDWLKDLMATDGPAARRLANRLGKLFDEYNIDVRTPGGEEVRFHIKAL